MKFARSLLILVVATEMTSRSSILGGTLPPNAAPGPLPGAWEARGQEWLADPVLPAPFQSPAEGSTPDDWGPFSADALEFDGRPLAEVAQALILEAPSIGGESPPSESSFPRGVTARDIQAWRDEDDLRRIREWAGDALFGVPLLVPEVMIEALLPRGLSVGPTTYLYRTSQAPSSLALVVFDQVLFHEAQFLSRMQAQSDSPLEGRDLAHGQRHVLRQSFLGGFRATYAMPGVTLDLVLKTAAEQGWAGYLLAAPIGGTLLYLKGIDHKLQIEDPVTVRFKVAPGQEWTRGLRSDVGLPAVSFEIRFCDVPVGFVGSFDVSGRGLIPAFIGLGTSLDAVEDLLIRENFAGARSAAAR